MELIKWQLVEEALTNLRAGYSNWLTLRHTTQAERELAAFKVMLLDELLLEYRAVADANGWTCQPVVVIHPATPVGTKGEAT